MAGAAADRGLGDAESPVLDPYGWRVRRADHAFLTSPRARALLEQEGIVSTDYRPLQRAWTRPAQAGG